MNFTKNFLENQKPYLDKYVHHTMFSLINFVIFCAIKNRFIAYFICLGLAIGWEFLQKSLGGTNNAKEMAMDAVMSQLSAIMFLGVLSVNSID